MSKPLADQSPNKIIEILGKAAKKAAFTLAQTPVEIIDKTLTTLSTLLLERSDDILAANKIDVDNARMNGLNDALIDRLALDKARISAMAKGIETVRDLNDPCGKILWTQNRPNGLKIERISCPIGVLGMIYESRPNVTIDASILSLKSHNAVILRGGSESLNSALALHKVIEDALTTNGLPRSCVSIIPLADRSLVSALLQADKYIDVMIPRGGKGLIERVMNEARMPVFSHLEGLCHIYIDKNVDEKIAINVPLNAKMRRTGICGAMETLLLDSALDRGLAAKIIKNILDTGCLVVGDADVQALDERIGAATEEDWHTEYLDAKLSCRMINGVEEAVAFINTNGSHHTDSILSENHVAVTYFQQNVDSGIVMHNTSTQFADGGEFGMGAEIGIATGKMHARGPVGLDQLCTYKYLVHGHGQTRP